MRMIGRVGIMGIEGTMKGRLLFFRRRNPVAELKGMQNQYRYFLNENLQGRQDEVVRIAFMKSLKGEAMLKFFNAEKILAVLKAKQCCDARVLYVGRQMLFHL